MCNNAEYQNISGTAGQNNEHHDTGKMCIELHGHLRGNPGTQKTAGSHNKTINKGNLMMTGKDDQRNRRHHQTLKQTDGTGRYHVYFEAPVYRGNPQKSSAGLNKSGISTDQKKDKLCENIYLVFCTIGLCSGGNILRFLFGLKYHIDYYQYNDAEYYIVQKMFIEMHSSERAD